jgi:hypothetical protein
MNEHWFPVVGGCGLQACHINATLGWFPWTPSEPYATCMGTYSCGAWSPDDHLPLHPNQCAKFTSAIAPTSVNFLWVYCHMVAPKPEQVHVVMIPCHDQTSRFCLHPKPRGRDDCWCFLCNSTNVRNCQCSTSPRVSSRYLICLIPSEALTISCLRWKHK